MTDGRLAFEFALGLLGWGLAAACLAGIPWAVLVLIAKAIWSLW